MTLETLPLATAEARQAPVTLLDQVQGDGRTGSVLVRPELPAHADPLSLSERRAIALAAFGYSSSGITAKLVEERHRLPRAGGLGTIWSTAAKKLGAERSRPQGRQAELVFRARIHGVLDAPDPKDLAHRLPPDALHYAQALARGMTLKDYAQDLDVPVWEIDDIAKRTRALLDGATTQASTVYRALPQLLPAVQPPVETFLPLARPQLLVASLETELPGSLRALRAGRRWIRECLPALGWAGSVLDAAEVITRLLDNGVRHGQPDDPSAQSLLVLRVAVSNEGELVIDVTDLNPSFPAFDAAARGERGLGLRRVREHGARVEWFLHHEGHGKTVRALLPPSPVSP